MKFNVQNPAEAFDRSNDKLIVVNPSTRKVAQRPISDVLDIIDNLSTTDNDKPLSANQGKVLKDLIDSLQDVNKTVWLFNPTLNQVDTVRIRRAYDFEFSVEVAYNCEVISQPPAQSLSDTNYLLSFKGTDTNAVLVVVLKAYEHGSNITPGIASLTLDLAATNTSVVPTVNFEATAKVTNGGPNQATNVVLEVYIPTGMQFVSLSTSNYYSYSYILATKTLRLFYPNVAINQEIIATLTLSATQSGNLTGQIASCNQPILNAYAGNGVIGEPDDDTLAFTVANASVDLSLGLTASNYNPATNVQVAFTATLNNSSSNNGTGIVWAGTLPTGLTWISGSGVSYNANTNTISATISTIAPSIPDIRTFICEVKPDAVLTTQSVVIQIIQANEPDPDSTPNNSNGFEDDQTSVSLFIQGTTGLPDPEALLDGNNWILDAEYIVVGNPQYGGGTGGESGSRNIGAYLNVDVSNRYPETETNFTLSIFVRNDSQAAYGTETATLTLPNGITYVSAISNNFTYNNNVITINANGLAAGAYLLAQATIKATTTGTKTLTASINDTIHTASVSVTPSQTARDITAFLAIDANNTNPAANDVITVSLYVRNDSASTYSGEVLRHILPSGKLSFVAFTTNPSNVASISSGVITAAANLAANDALLIQFTATVIASVAGSFQITETLDGTIHTASKTINFNI